SIARIDEVLAQPSAPVPPDERRVVLPTRALDVELDAVTYGYDGARVLDRCDLRISPGEIVALVGSTGAGKSTITNLLIRADDPGSGAVRIGGVDLRDADPASLRASVAVVFQES